MEPPADALEQFVIRTLLDAAPPPGDLLLPPGDDAAVFADGTAVTTDALVEGVHWDDRLSAEDVGFKVLAASVSDLAAVGASPDWAVLDLCLPDPLDREWVAGFARGLASALARYRVRLVGGDTTRSPGARFAAITLAGRCVGRPLARSGARAGDELWVTGIPGLAGTGWMAADPPPEALEALRRPSPPLEFALDVARADLAHAAMDLSDGLAADLPRLCAASAVGAAIDPAALPAHPALGDHPIEAQLGGGDDYQLLLAASPSAAPALRALAADRGVALSRIGRVTADRALSLGGGPWPGPRFAHFRGMS